MAGPIGNLEDLTSRAARFLAEAEAWLVEDSRVSGRLQAHLGIKRPMRVLNEHTPRHRLEEWARAAADGSRFALLTDAGTPGISDPGAELVDLCHQLGAPVDAAPGPSAVTCALSISGFYAQRFAFLGFLPRKKGAAIAEVAPFAESPLTLVFFESPHRVGQLIGWLGEVLGERRYAIGRELTKMHQQLYRARLPEAPDPATVPARGEITLVVEGKRKAGRAE